MKTKKYFFPVAGFIAGIVLGLSVAGLYSFTFGPSPSVSSAAPVAVTAATAKTYTAGYMTKATAVNAVIKGFTIDKSQVDAINSLLRENAAFTAFRIYMGASGTTNVGIVCGVDNLGKDVITNTIYSTDTKLLSPCPPICDQTSAIISQ